MTLTHVAGSCFLSRVLLCALAFALWFATTLGLMHRVVHGVVTAPLAAAVIADPDVRAHGEAHKGLATLFGDHSDAECRLYDQLSHGPAALCVPALILPVSLPAATFAYLEGEFVARWVALFDARGPPSTR